MIQTYSHELLSMCFYSIRLILWHIPNIPQLQLRQYECSSVINRFYQGFVNQSFLSKIKKKVTAALEHHEAVMAKESDEDEKDASHSVQV